MSFCAKNIDARCRDRHVARRFNVARSLSVGRFSISGNSGPRGLEAGKGPGLGHINRKKPDMTVQMMYYTCVIYIHDYIYTMCIIIHCILYTIISMSKWRRDKLFRCQPGSEERFNHNRGVLGYFKFRVEEAPGAIN